MKKSILFMVAAAALALPSQGVHAAGFALIEQSVSSMGTAYAGGAASAQDASTIYFNPAGMMRLCGTQVVSGIHGVFPRADFTNEGSIFSTAIPSSPIGADPGPGDPIPGSNGRDAGSPAAVPHFSIAKRVNRCWAVGLSLNSPFGLVTDYDDGWVGRYHALRSALFTLNINPSLAYQLTPTVSIGVGFNAMYLHANLTNAVDYGTIAWINAGENGAIQGGLDALDFQPGTQDGNAQVKGDSWGYGANIGLLWEPTCQTRLGLQYRSQVYHNVKGKINYSNLPTAVSDPSSTGGLSTFFSAIQAGAATNQGATAGVKLPATVSVSGFHQINQCWAIMGDITWTNWSVQDNLTFNFDGGQDPTVTTLKWKDTFRYSIGTEFRPNCKWVFRTGFAYDPTPIPSPEFRTPRIPGEDRYWLAFGFGYQWNACLHIDVGYAHLFVPDPKIDKTSFALEEDNFRGGLKGRYSASTDIVSAQVVYNF